MKKILITGATGHFGKAVINHLLKTIPANQLVALVRDEQKAQDLKEKGVTISIGHYDDKASIEKAMTDVEKVLLVSGMDMNRFEQHRNVIDAAKKQGVKLLAYTGVTIRDLENSAIKGLMESHFQTEEYLKVSGLNYTFLRNSLYTEVIPMYVGEKVFETGVFFPAEGGKTSFVSRNELAEVAAKVLTNPGHENKTYELTGSKAYTFDEITHTLSDLSGKSLAYVSPEPTVFESQLKQFGVPEMGVMIAAGFAADIRNARFETVSMDLETLLGRKPSDLKQGLKNVFQL